MLAIMVACLRRVNSRGGWELGDHDRKLVILRGGSIRRLTISGLLLEWDRSRENLRAIQIKPKLRQA
jgi:hypothetical protein